MTSATHKINARLSGLLSAFLLSLSVILGVQGCSSGGSSTPVVPVDSDPVGYFTGTATLNAGTQNDMVGMAYANRLMVFSMTENVLFDITMDITLTDFTGTVDVYVNGLITGTGVTVSGTTTNSRIEGTFAGGSGLSAGSFDVLFDTNNNLGATLARVEGSLFTGNISGIDVEIGGGLGASSNTYNISDSFVDLCRAVSSFVLPDADINIYQLDHEVVLIPSSGGTCDVPYAGTGYTGFASVIASTNPNDTFVFAYANGNVALFSEGLTR